MLADESHKLRTIEATMELLEISRSQVYRLGKKNDLELVKVGTRTRVKQESIDNYVKNLPPMVSHRK
jgi:excisionase family DNA binding protein